MFKNILISKVFLGIFILAFFSFVGTVLASNPTAPFSPNDNVLDPGDSGTDWGGCGPEDSNCYVSTPWTVNEDSDIYFDGNVGIGTGATFPGSAALQVQGGANTLGDEEISFGDFSETGGGDGNDVPDHDLRDNPDAWTLGANWENPNDTLLEHTPGSTEPVTRDSDIPVVVGKTYTYKAYQQSISAGSVTIKFGGTILGILDDSVPTGIFEFSGVATTTDGLELIPTSDYDGNWYADEVGDCDCGAGVHHEVSWIAEDEGWYFSDNKATHTPSTGAIVGLDDYEEGTGYEVDDVLTPDGGNNDATFTVTEVGGSGEITDFEITTAGTGYEDGEDYDLAGGHGAGAALYSVEVDNKGSFSQPGTLTDGSSYQVTATIGGTEGSVEICLGGDGECEEFDAGSDETAFIGKWYDADSKIRFAPSADFDGTIEDVSMKEVGFSAVQSWYNSTGGEVFRVDSGGNLYINDELFAQSQWTTNDNDNIYFDNRVGIGTNDPAKLLDVRGGISAGSGGACDGNSGYFFGPGGDEDGGMFSPEDGVIAWQTNCGEQMRLQGGNLGIGTDDPVVKFQVEGSLGSFGVSLESGFEFPGAVAYLVAVEDEDSSLGLFSSGEGSSGLLLQSGGGSALLAMDEFDVLSLDHDLTINGDLTIDSCTGCADYAEAYEAENKSDLEPGDILAVNTEGKVIKANTDTTVIGIYSTSPGLLIGSQNGINIGGENATLEDDEVPVALVGRVPVKFSNANGDALPGDKLALSTTPGVAIKQTSSGDSIGTALTTSSEGTVLMFVNLSYKQFTELTLPEPVVLDEPFFNAIISWFADTANGITDFFAGRVQTDELCIGQTCVDEDKLKTLLENNNLNTEPTQPAEDTAPEEPPTGDPEVTPPQGGVDQPPVDETPDETP